MEYFSEARVGCLLVYSKYPPHLAIRLAEMRVLVPVVRGDRGSRVEPGQTDSVFGQGATLGGAPRPASCLGGCLSTTVGDPPA
jgi:hypothetical protein